MKIKKAITKPPNLLTIIMLSAALVVYVISFGVKQNDLKELLENMAWGFVTSSIILRFMLKWKIGNKPAREEIEIRQK